MSKYSDKLKDPRWQKKRLEILQRDSFACQKCYDDESTLNVHHKLYLPNIDPWDYPDELLITLCENCHENELLNTSNVDKGIIEILHTLFLTESINDLKCAFNNIQMVRMPEVTASIISWAISSPEIMEMLDDKFFEYLHAKAVAKNAKQNT